MIVVVSDTSPIRALVHLNWVTLLSDLFQTVLVPPAVEVELMHPPGRLAKIDVGGYPFLRVQAPKDPARVRQFRQSLDAGESEALALAMETRASIVLVDELEGRAMAAQLGFTVMGTLGILLKAKSLRLTGAIRPLVGRLETELGFFLSDDLKAELFRRAGE